MIIFVWLLGIFFGIAAYNAVTWATFLMYALCSFGVLYFAWWGTPALHMAGNIKPKRITEWRWICDEDDLNKAIADVTATPFGRVGQHIGYHISETARQSMRNWDYADRLNVAWLLDHPQSRIDIGNTTRADIGNIRSPRAQ